MEPQSPDEWMQIAEDRRHEARLIHKHKGVKSAIGSAYLCGYGVECALKAHAKAEGKNVIKTHDLGNLLRNTQLTYRNLKSDSWFVDAWSVDWRYAVRVETLPKSPVECLNAAGRLQSYIAKQMNRQIAQLRRRQK